MIKRTESRLGLVLVLSAAACSGSPDAESTTGAAAVTGTATTGMVGTTGSTATSAGGATTASAASATATGTTGSTDATTTAGVGGSTATTTVGTTGAAGTAGATSTTSTTTSAGGAGGTSASTTGASTTGDPPVVDDSLFTVQAELASDEDASAPTTVGIVTWSINSVTPTSAYIEFGLDTTYGMQAPVDLGEADFRTLLLGMKPDNTYHFRVVASDGTTNYASEDYSITTGAETNAVGIGSFNVVQDTGRERGFIVLSYWAGTGSSAAFIIDADGAIVWAYDFGMSGGIARARVSYSGRDMWAISASNNGQPLRRVGMDGLDMQEYGSTSGSHDIAAVSGDLMAYLDYTVSCNNIVEIDPSGSTNTVFTASGTFGTQCHGNALRYSEAEDVYTYSEVGTDIVQVSRAGAVQWSLADVAGGVNTWGGVNHGHHLLSNSILIFANSGGQGNSAMIEYDLSGNEIDRYDSGDTSQNLGDVQRLPGGNTLIDFSNDGVIHQIDASGNVLVEITGTGGMNRFGYATWRPTLYGPSPDITD